jgi:hypothetical protein
MNDLFGRRLEAFRDAFLAAFPHEDDFSSFLTLRLQQEIERLAKAGTWNNRLLEVIECARDNQWADALYREARGQLPQNLRLQELDILGLASFKKLVDVNLCFSLNDVAWVAEHVVPRLLHAGLSFTMPLRDNHHRLGKNGITEALESATSTLLLMTPSFVTDNWDVVDQAPAFQYLRQTKTRLLAVLKDDGKWPPAIMGDPLPSVNVTTGDEASWASLMARLVTLRQQQRAAPAVFTGLPSPQSSMQAFVDGATDDPAARSALGTSGAVLESVVLQITRVTEYKRVHDLLQKLENECGQMVLELWAAVPNWAAAAFRTTDIREIGNRLVATAAGVNFANAETRWVVRLRKGLERMEHAVHSRTPQEVQQAVEDVTHLPGNPMSTVNIALVTAVAALDLPRLEQELGKVQSALGEKRSTNLELSESREAVALFARSINANLYLHNAFQDIEDEVRLVHQVLNVRPDELRRCWSEIGPRTRRLCESGGFACAARLLRSVEALDDAIRQEAPGTLREPFDTFLQTVTKAFTEVDTSLLTICDRLRQEVGSPLAVLLKLLQKAA